ncbi:MAG: CcdB family protein [Rhizomicrobium sp.]
MAPTPSTIRQLDVVRNPIRAARDVKPFLVCLQHHLLDHLSTRVLAVLAVKPESGERSRLYPAVRIESDILYFNPTDLMTLPVRLLGKPIANLEAERDRIIAALDMVFTGI